MTSQNPDSRNEIIIVRRSAPSEHGEHHGGVWKIAYADFMTAMMAFFLVMWLINAANEETKAAVASYFNPIKLVDRRSQPRGLEENESAKTKGSQDKSATTIEKNNNTQNATESEQQSSVETSTDQAQMMREPYQTLDEIAEVQQGTGARLDGSGGVQQGGSQQGASNGTAYKDPFSPEYWSSNISPQSLSLADQANVKTGDGNGHQAQIQAMLQGQPQQQNTMQTEQEQTQQQTIANPNEVENNGNVLAVVDADNKGQDDKAATGNALPTEVDKISGELAELLDKQPGGLQPIVHVVPVDDGVAIELMDQTNFGMFSVGSSKPDKQTIELLAGIAKILQNQQGDIIISGHTDSRPYRSTTYDNWQLSSARAQMAYYMLVRGGLDEKRILRVEGYADRELKNKQDPYAPENRRIEIFIRNPKSKATPVANPQPAPVTSTGQPL